MKATKNQHNFIPLLCTILFFAVFLVCGLRIYDDYGPVSEEKNQIDAGHIIWAYITGDDSHFPELPELEVYMNRYYGQGATFITVLLEAVSGFTWDVNRVWKVRRLWNFFTFFTAVICLFAMIKRRYKSCLAAFPAALMLILLPRMFPEVFYNDRDPLFLSWLIFSFCAMLFFIRKPNFFTSLLFGVVFAFTVNVRMFGLMLLIPIFMIFCEYPSLRRWLIFVLLAFLIAWYALSPIAWKDPINVVWSSVVHLTTKQRMIDTRGTSELLFAGKYYPEQSLPWFYLPLWILISTPIMTLALFLLGMIFRLRSCKGKDDEGYFIVDRSLAVFFLLFIIAVPVLRPTLYSGWRHFYFLNLPIVWFAVYGLYRILKMKNRLAGYMVFALEGISLVMSLFWMISAHPFEGVYYEPVFRQAAADNFERDTGYISTMDCLNFLADTAQDQKIEVMNANAYIPFSLIGLPKPVRDRFSTIDWKILRTPMKYVIFNYNNMQGNEMSFPYYAPVYNIERNGTKLAEVFQRTNNNLLDPDLSVESIHASVNDEYAVRMLSEDDGELWFGDEIHDPQESITILLQDDIRLESLELFPGDHADVSESLNFLTSDDGINWAGIEAEAYGTNGWLFSSFPSKYLRIQSSSSADQPWQVRQILLYGSAE